MNYEPQIIDYYSGERLFERQNQRIIRQRRIARLSKVYLMRRVLTAWRYSHQRSLRSLASLLNYQKFHELPELPDYTIVSKSSAGITGWLRAGPHTYRD